MKRFALTGAAVAALIAFPAFAQQSAPVKPNPTRAAIQAGVQAEFAKVDTNKDGFVTGAEAQAATAAARSAFQALRTENRAELFTRLDTNKDGALTRAEFEAPPAAQAAGQARNRQAERQRRSGAMAGLMFAPTRFQAMDANKDGKVSLAEASVQGLARFDRIDANRDGIISPEEGRFARSGGRQQRRGS
jgi:Ca2+-binding EF-hand superfamily protein